MAVSASKLASMRAKLAGGSKPNPVKKTRSRPKTKAKKATSKSRKAVAKPKANPVKSRKTTKARKSTAARTKPRARTRAPLSSSQIMQQNRATGGIPALPIPGRVSARAHQTSLFTEANPMEIIDEGAGGAGLAAARAKVEAARMARKATAKKSSKRKSASKKSKKSARKATAAGRSSTAKKVASKRASVKRKSSKRKSSKRAAPVAPVAATRKTSKRKTSKRKSSKRAALSRGRGKLAKTVVTRTYLSNPQIEAKDIAAFGGGLVGGILVADIIDRFVATRTPEGKSNPLYGTEAMAAIHKKCGEDPVRLVATGGGAAVAGFGAYMLRDRLPTAAYGFAGLAAGFGMKVLGQLLSDYAVPWMFKQEKADDWSARLFPDYQEAPAVAPGTGAGPRFGYTYGPYGQMGAPRPFAASPAVGSHGAVGGCGGGGIPRYPYGANQRLAQAMSAVRSRDLSKVFPRVGSQGGCNCGVMPPHGQGCQVCGTAPAPVAPGAVPTPQPQPFTPPRVDVVRPFTPPIADVIRPSTPIAVPSRPVANGDGDEGRNYQLHPQAQDSIARKVAIKEAERRKIVIPATNGRDSNSRDTGDVKGPPEQGSNGALAVMRMAKRPAKKASRRR